MYYMYTYMITFISTTAHNEQNSNEGGNIMATADNNNQKFESMCGAAFNPAKKSSCNTTCKNEHEEAFKACKLNFESTEVTATAAKKQVLGMNIWGHRNGCQGDKIDQWLLSGGRGTRETIAEELNLRIARVKSHVGHLIKDKPELPIIIDKDGRYFYANANGNTKRWAAAVEKHQKQLEKQAAAD